MIDTVLARNFDWRGAKMEKSCDVSLVTFFGDNYDDAITDLFKIRFHAY